MSKIAVFLNGQAPKIFPDLKQFEKAYCTDGAYKYLKNNNIKPDLVCGDFDSFPIDEIPDDIEVVEMQDQNFTDFEKCLELIVLRNYKEVYIYGSSGMEHDHFLGNLTTGLKFKDKLTMLFFDDYSYYFFSDKKCVLEGYNGRIISLYPFPVAKNIVTQGLQYPLNNEDLDLTSRVGTRNTGISDLIEITYEKGNMLIFIKNV